MLKGKLKLDVTNLDNFEYDMSKCIKCKGCTWVDHIYMSGMKFSTRCPSATKYLFDSYGAYGKMRIGTAMLEGRMDYSDELLEILYANTLQVSRQPGGYGRYQHGGKPGYLSFPLRHDG